MKSVLIFFIYIFQQQQSGPTRTLTHLEEFLLTLIKLRCGLQSHQIADMFGVSLTLVSHVFTTWINFLYVELTFLIQRPTVDQIRNKLPSVFKFYPKTRCIIDCSKFSIQRPSVASLQRKTCSSYKHRNQAKVLIGVSPKWNITFVSSLWFGSISKIRIFRPPRKWRWHNGRHGFAKLQPQLSTCS